MQRVEVRLEDDLTGGPADETVRFGVDGRDYELDLNNRHAIEFRRQLAPFVEHARLVLRERTHARMRTAASRERSREIRAWAEGQGFSVAEHGRLPGNVIHEYERAHDAHAPAERTGQRSAGRRTASSGRATAKSQSRAKPKRRRPAGHLARPTGRKRALPRRMRV
jgi:hypothetical protein